MFFELCKPFDTHGMRAKESTELESAEAEVAEIEEGLDSNNEDRRQINLVESLHDNAFSSEILVENY